ncbi:MAG: S-layer homology domain-containing protein [Armatimonadota bacterium]
MKKVLLGVFVLGLMLVASYAFAQGPFADVPTDHWAYDAVNELQEAGIVIGYPDGTFGGRRAMTRYEFAVAVARMIPVIEQKVMESVGTMTSGVTPEQVNKLEQRVSALEQKPAAAAGVTQEQLASIQRLVNEFRDELAALGVDVDTLKRDVASLAARVDAIEKEQQRVKITGEIDPFAIATSVDTNAPFDLDGRAFQPEGPAGGDLVNSIDFVRNMDLGINGSLAPSVNIVTDINYGNYIPVYLGGTVTDYVGTVRPSGSAGDDFFPYYMYVQAGLGKGALKVGRIPVQYTPYTMKKIDVDSYTNIKITDSGDYPLDGVAMAWKFGSVSVNSFAAKTNNNSVLGAGLVSQPTIALYDDSADGITPAVAGAPFNVAGGHAAGGLATINQAAGTQVRFGTPFQGNLGLTFIQAAGPVATTAVTGLATSYDTVDIMGADGRWLFGNFMVGAEYTQTKTTGDAGVADVDDNNTAIDGNIGFGLGKLSAKLGWRQVENNFTAPGYWEKVGMWTNPTNVEGPYVNLAYPIIPNVNVVANGAFYSGANDVPTLVDVMDTTDDDLWKADLGLRWGVSTANSLNLGYEFVRWSPDGVGADDTDETYLTIGWGYQINPSAGFNIGYQIIDYDPSGTVCPYGTADYKGSVAVAQFKARF